jgi:hypothetical protein
VKNLKKVISIIVAMAIFVSIVQFKGIQEAQAYTQNQNVLLNTTPTSADNWKLTGMYFEDNYFQGFGSAVQSVYLTENDKARANLGQLTVSGSYKMYSYLWAWGTNERWGKLGIAFLNSSNYVISTVETPEDSKSSGWFTFSISDTAVPAGTEKIYYIVSIRGKGAHSETKDFNMVIKDSTAPFFANLVPASPQGTYKAGDNVYFDIKFSEPVNVTNGGYLEMNPAGTAQYSSQPAPDTLRYMYTIPSDGMPLSDSNTVSPKKIVNTSVSDDSANTLSLNGKTDGISVNGFFMDNRPPETAAASMTVEGGSQNSVLNEGKVLIFNVQFHENVYSDGTSYIQLSNGKKAVANVINSGNTSTKTVNFSYKVGKDDDTDNLAITGVDFTGVKDYVGQSARLYTGYNQNMFNSKLDGYNMKIDTNPPDITFSNVPDSWQNTSLDVKVTATDDVVSGVSGSGVKELYSKWTSTSSSQPTFGSVPDIGGDGSVPVPGSSGVYSLWVKAVDNSGNQSITKSAYTYKIDAENPAITVTPSYVGGTQIVSGIKAAITDITSGIFSKKFSWKNPSSLEVLNGDVPDNGDIPYPDIDGIFSMSVTAFDYAQNKSESLTQNLNVDATAPTISFAPNGSEGYVRSISVVPSVSDAKSGVDKWYYVWLNSSAAPESNSEQWTLGNAAIKAPEGLTGTYYLHIKAVDKCGNVGIATSSPYLFDNSPPSIVVVPNGNADNIGRSVYEIGVNYTDNVSIKSDITVVYAFSSSETPDGLTFRAYPDKGLTLSDFKQNTYLYIKATDKLGNESVMKSAPFIADTAAPTGSIKRTSSEETNAATADFSFDADDNYSTKGKIEMQITVDGTEEAWEPLISSKTVAIAATNGNHTVSARYRDESGNISEAYQADVIYDADAPVIKISYSTETDTNGDVVVSAITENPKDRIIGQDTYTLTQNEEEVTFYAKDNAGNTSQQTAKVTWIDKVLPVIEMSSAQLDNKPHKSVDVAVNATDNKKLSKLEYRFIKSGESGGEWLEISSGDNVNLSAADGVFNIEARATDHVGNIATKTYGPFILDNTAPEAVISYTPSKRTANNVEAKISFNEKAFITNNNASDTYIFNDNGEFNFEYKDEAGNTSSKLAVVDWIDRSKPQSRLELTDESGQKKVSIDQWVNYNLKVTIVPPAQCVVENVTFNGKKVEESDEIERTDALTDTYIVKSYGVLAYTVKDTETQMESENENTIRIDKQAPQVSQVVKSNENWTNKDVIVTLKATDDLSGVTYVDGDTYTFTQNGSHTFSFMDNAGNTAEYTAEVTNIDKEVPTAVINYYLPDGSKWDGYWTNKSIKAVLTLTSLSPAHADGLDSYTFNGNGSYTFSFDDEAGNTGSIVASVDKIDKIAPDGYITYSCYTWTNKDVVATLHASDNLSGAEDLTYTYIQNGAHNFELYDKAGNLTSFSSSFDRIDKTAPIVSLEYTPPVKTPFNVFAKAAADEPVTWSNNINTYKFISNGSYEFVATDRAGNVTKQAAKVEYIDNSLPEAELVYSTKEMTNENVYVTLKTKDPEENIYILNNRGSSVHQFTENGEFTFQYTNAAGAIGELTAQVTNIDKTAPEIKVSYSTKELTNQPVTVTFTANKQVVWPNEMKVNEDGSASMTFEQDRSLSVKIPDLLGNTVTVEVYVLNIDARPPVIAADNQYTALEKGKAFDPMPGVSVTDNKDKAVKLKADSSKVNTDIPGDYEAEYSATDSAGNEAHYIRYITVYDPTKFNVSINGKMPVAGAVTLGSRKMEITAINSAKIVNVQVLPGKKFIGDFKSEDTFVGLSYNFSERGWYSVYITDIECNNILVYVFAE